MGKALMISSSVTSALGSGDEFNVFGYSIDATTEANTQASATEDASFTGLGFRVQSGGSGTNTLTFRDAGAAGQQTCAVTGAGIAEDTTHTDSLTAGDLFNIAYTDTGTNSTCSWGKMNVELASGHGNFHGAANYAGVVCDVASSTRFIGFSGTITTDAEATEDNAEWKVRGYDSVAALQVRVTANARTNDSIFRNRINGADGTGIVTFTTGATGLLTDTAIGDSLSSGDTINASLTLGTGVEDLTVTFVCATLKSSTSKSEVWCHNNAGVARAASATANYHPIGGAIADLTTIGSDANARIKPGFAGVAGNLRCYLEANTYGGTGTLKLMQNGVAVITTNITASGGAGWYENTTDTVSFDDNDEFSLEFDEGTSGSITLNSAGLTFSPAGSNPVGRLVAGTLLRGGILSGRLV